MATVSVRVAIMVARKLKPSRTASPSRVAAQCLSRVLETRDEITHGHAARVGVLAARLAGLLGLPAKRCEEISRAALMHDIGKLVIPLEIIQRPFPLSQEEWGIIQTHSRHGYTILSGTGDPDLELAAEIALHHHERHDGSGYPDGLKGHDISLPNRITAICDVYDALRQNRPYRSGMSHRDAMRVIINGDHRTAPGQFDPDVLSAFQGISGEVDAYYTANTDEKLHGHVTTGTTLDRILKASW